MKFGMGNYGPHRMYPADFPDPLTLPLAPPAGENVLNTLAYNK